MRKGGRVKGRIEEKLELYIMIYGSNRPTHCTYANTGQIFEQSRSSEETDRNVDVSICFFTAT